MEIILPGTKQNKNDHYAGQGQGGAFLPPPALAVASHMLALRLLSLSIYSSSGATRQRRALLIPTGAARKAPSLVTTASSLHRSGHLANLIIAP